jgi:glycosyltransferase involved in cell wall biosynthesis
MAPLNILHVFRAPVGGLFRHVRDLARGQAERGHRVGLIADSTTGGANAEALLAELAPSLALGITRIPIRRQPNPGDFVALRRVRERIGQTEADVVHGHGAKGGAFARLACNRHTAVRAYMPHGGTLQFEPGSLAGSVYLTTEKLLLPRGSLYLFESEFSARTFHRKIGEPRALQRVVHNGVTKAEFEPVPVAADATDLVFLGELRVLKGVDVLINAIGELRAQGRDVSATLVGDGPDRDMFHAQAAKLELGDRITFRQPMPARQAMALGHVMVAPSRLDSMPYVVLEALAAGKPLIATHVGGIPEIFGPFADRLIPAENAALLAQAIVNTMQAPKAAAEVAARLRERVAENFSIDGMVDGILAAYRESFGTLKNIRQR